MGKKRLPLNQEAAPHGPPPWVKLTPRPLDDFDWLKLVFLEMGTSGCPHAQAALAVQACPFLRQLAAREGEEYAAAVATHPTRPARGVQPLLPEPEALLQTFRLFHGAGGVVPLEGFDLRVRTLETAAPGPPPPPPPPPDLRRPAMMAARPLCRRPQRPRRALLWPL